MTQPVQITADDGVNGLPLLAKEFGQGWMTGNASDLCKIAVAFANFTPWEIVCRIHAIHKGKGLVNATTVAKALEQIKQEHDARIQNAGEEK